MAACLIAAVASLLRGGKYVHGAEQESAVQAQAEADSGFVPADELVPAGELAPAALAAADEHAPAEHAAGEHAAGERLRPVTGPVRWRAERADR